MDFRLSPDAEALRTQVQGELTRILSPELTRGDVYERHWDGVKQFTRDLAARGWHIPAWPREWGGSAMPLDQQVVLSEELAYAGAPNSHNVNRVGYTGPTIMVAGTDEQRKQHLPGIASSEVMWAQGFSEPGAGSDLASLQTRAVRQGDDYILNGQKIWTSFAHVSDWMIFLARTDPEAPKHRGISFFLIDMKSPGITIRPLISPDDHHHFNEVFLEDVRVPRENMVGAENRGWYVGTATLDFERSSVATMGHARRQLRLLGEALRDSPVRNHAREVRFAALAVEVEVAKMLCYRVTSMQMKGQIPNAESSAAKLFNSEVSQRLAAAGPNMLGMRGNLFGGEEGGLARGYVASIAATIGGGTSEVQRNIMATRGLGLPR